jgi:nucleoside-diphosphate-sugar epimerase
VVLLKNLLATIEQRCPALRHVTLLQGAKAYGSHLGPFRTPARETDPRHMPPNFYYDQEDLLVRAQEHASWTWTILRPTTVYGFSVGSSMNLSLVIGVYAAISRALGLPLRFPGTKAAYEVIRQGVDADLLAEVILWSGDSDKAANQTFNVTNGDLFRWSAMWPFIADVCGMPVADPQRIPLAEFMAQKEELWAAIARRNGLRSDSYGELVSWPFGTANFDREYDHILDTTKLRSAGFSGFRDSFEMMRAQLVWLWERRVIPTPTGNATTSASPAVLL